MGEIVRRRILQDRRKSLYRHSYEYGVEAWHLHLLQQEPTVVGGEWDDESKYVFVPGKRASWVVGC